MKNIDIINNYYKLNKMLLNTKPLPAKVSFSIVRNINTLRSIVQDIEQVKYGIASHYGTQDKDDPAWFALSEENMEVANKELNELYETDTNVELMHINLSDIENVEFTPTEMDALMFMIED